MDALASLSHQSGSSATAGSSGLSPDQRRTLVLLRVGVVLGVVLPLILFGIVATVRYEQIWKEREMSTERTARIVSEHALKLFDTNEVLLQRLGDLVDGLSNEQVTAAEPLLHAKLLHMVAGLPQVQSVWVIDADAHPLLTNRFAPAPRKLDLSDREWFKAHKNGMRGIYVSEPVVGKITRDVLFNLSRPLFNPDGSFRGTVQVGIFPSYLIDFYRDVAAEEEGTTVTMVRSDGSVIARWPDNGPRTKLSAASSLLQEMQSGRASGTLMLTSTVDEVHRLVSFRKLRDYPVYVAAALGSSAVIADWAHEMMWLALFTVPGSAALGAAGWLALRKARRELGLANRLYQESIQRKHVEHALLHAQKMEALGHLTGGVAHDFNNLLMVIGMNAHLLRQTVGGMESNPRLEAIQRSVGNGAKLTRQLLSFSRRQPLLPSTIDLRAELPAIVELCAPVLGQAIDLSVEVARDTPSLVIDRAELELSLINLAINARHAMPDGGRLAVSAGPVASGQIEIVVRDSGCGIAPEILARVTEPFYSTRPNGVGTGLGLSQVNTMCQRAGGSLHIDSVLGAGTTVRLRLPAAELAAQPAQAEAVAGARFPIRVLLVEDNNEIAAATRLALESLGCTVERCVNADEAVQIMAGAARLPDAVLSDITMPGTLDGIALARHLRLHYPQLPVALMSGYAERLVDAEALHLRVLPKPFDVHGLRQMLAYLMSDRPTASQDEAATSA
jgi:signal transduction histidine kinase/ActR/RegA family two-component response regulator